MIKKCAKKTRCKIFQRKSSDFDKIIFNWFTEKRGIIAPINSTFKRLNDYDWSEIVDAYNLKASNGWLDKYKQRYGIQLLIMQGEKVSSNHEAHWQPVTRKKLLVLEERITIMNCANATDTHKVPLLAIGDKSPRSFKNVKMPVLICTSKPNAGMVHGPFPLVY